MSTNENDPSPVTGDDYTQNAKDWEFKNLMTVNDFGWTKAGYSEYDDYVLDKLSEGVANGYISAREASAIAANMNIETKKWSY